MLTIPVMVEYISHLEEPRKRLLVIRGNKQVIQEVNYGKIFSLTPKCLPRELIVKRFLLYRRDFLVRYNYIT
jgi:hypothetical protein